MLLLIPKELTQILSIIMKQPRVHDTNNYVSKRFFFISKTMLPKVVMNWQKNGRE